MRENDIIFEPLAFRHWAVKNRIFRSNITGRFDNYDGSGTQARINWEEKFARGGVRAILSSFVPVHVRGRVQPNYAFIDDDNKIPFWRMVGKVVHQYDCRYILQLSHSGRQRDIPGVENFMRPGLSATGKKDYFHGLLCQAMIIEQIKEVVQMFAEGARRARKAGLDGVELHTSHGYLFTQFLSIGRPLVANNNLPQIIASGKDLADRPCSFCNRCLVNAVFNPLGCYDVRRFDGDQEAMIAEVMSVFNPPRYLPTHYSGTQSKRTANLSP